MFQKLIQAFRSVDVNLLVSRLCDQMPGYRSWQLGPHVCMADAFHNALSQFALMEKVLVKVVGNRCTFIIKNLVRPFQPWYTQLLRMCIQDPTLIPLFLNLLTDLNQNQHPFCMNRTLALAAGKISSNSIL